jgi:hypothetical protein
MNRPLQAVSLAGVIALAVAASPRAEIKPTIYGIAPGMAQAEAMAVLSGVAQCHVEKDALDEGYLPSGTYQLQTICQLDDGHSTLALRATSSLVDERITEIELTVHSQEAAEAAAAAVVLDHGLSLAAAEHVGAEWLWRLSERQDLALFAYPASDARAVVLRDTALQQEDTLARSAHSLASAVGVPGERIGNGG